jgi:hypothetical protein
MGGFFFFFRNCSQEKSWTGTDLDTTQDLDFSAIYPGLNDRINGWKRHKMEDTFGGPSSYSVDSAVRDPA